MKILCLTDFPVRPPDRWIWSYPSDHPAEVDFLWAKASDRSAALGKLVTRYPAYYRLAFQALSQSARKLYDLMVVWEASVGIPLALVARLWRRPTPPIVLLAFNPGDAPRIFQPLIHLGIKTVAHATVLTPTEATAYARRYAIPAGRITVSPLPSYDLYNEVQAQAATHPYAGEPYIHASGRSSRDYATLVAAVASLPTLCVYNG